MDKNIELFVHTGLAVILILTVCHLVGACMKYIRQPAVLGEMIGGVLLGPTLFGSLLPSAYTAVFYPVSSADGSLIEVKSVLFVLSNIGLSFYMFLVGAEIDYKYLSKKTLVHGGWLSLTATGVPFLLGMLAGWVFYDTLSNPQQVGETGFMIYMGTVLAITAFPMLARILQENKIVNTPMGVTALFSASVQDVISWILLAFVLVNLQGKDMQEGLIALTGAVVFVLVCFYLLRPLLLLIEKDMIRSGSMGPLHFAVVLIVVLSAALVTDKMGLYSVFGGFFTGLVMPRGALFQRELMSKLNDIVVVFFLPIFFAFSGLSTDLMQVIKPEIIIPGLVILALAFAGKYFPALFTMKALGYSWRESSAVGSLIYARGLMELIIGNIGLAYGIIPLSTFTVIVLVAVISTLAATPLFRLSIGSLPARAIPSAAPEPQQAGETSDRR